MPPPPRTPLLGTLPAGIPNVPFCWDYGPLGGLQAGLGCPFERFHYTEIDFSAKRGPRTTPKSISLPTSGECDEHRTSHRTSGGGFHLKPAKMKPADGFRPAACCNAQGMRAAECSVPSGLDCRFACSKAGVAPRGTQSTRLFAHRRQSALTFLHANGNLLHIRGPTRTHALEAVHIHS